MACSKAAENVIKWPDDIRICNKIIKKANNKWSEYGID